MLVMFLLLLSGEKGRVYKSKYMHKLLSCPKRMILLDTNGE
jgi:hypothetical protein